MSPDHNEESFLKGKAFEDFVENHLFPKSQYDLISKTNDYTQNANRYVQDSRNPDFTFRCKLTNYTFCVEAKFRTNPYQGKYEILSRQQFESFPSVDTTERPVFVALGYGGEAHDPQFISLVPYAKHKDNRYITVDEAASYVIPKESVNSQHLQQLNRVEQSRAQNISEEEIKIKTTPDNPTETKASKRQKNPVLWAAAAVILAVVGLGTFYAFDSVGTFLTPEEELQQRIVKYYDASDHHDIQQLDRFISIQVAQWYGNETIAKDEVIASIKDYQTQHPYAQSYVQSDQIDITKQNDGTYHATYPLTYMVKDHDTAAFKTYELRLITKWDEDMRLMSIKEIRL